MRENKVMPRTLSIALTMLLVIVSFHVFEIDETGNSTNAIAFESEEKTRVAIEFEDPDYTINASQYNFPIDLSKVDHLERILQYYPLNNSQTEFLKTHGFVNLGNSQYYDLVTLYKNLNAIGMAPYITTDTILHVYHIFFDEVLKEVEEGYFFDTLKEMTKQLINKTYWQSINVTTATVDVTHFYKTNSIHGPVNYTITETISLKEAALKNLAYLYVALKILDPTTIVPECVSDDVNAEMALINSKEGFFKSPIFDKSNVHPILTYIEDYSQYEPRGHYTRSEALKKYFNVMIWYSRMSFRMKSAMETVRAIFMSEAFNTQTALMWDQIYTITSFFVGNSDDLTLYDYKKLTSQIFGTFNNNYSQLLNTKLIQLYLDMVKELRKPRICSSLVMADLEDMMNATMGFRLMGQRFIPDSYMFQNLVFPNVGAYEGSGMPFTLSDIIGMGPGKGFSRGLEAMAVLGNEIAEDFIIMNGDDQYEKFDSQYGKLKAEFSIINESTWESNLYWGWLYALSSLNENFTASKYPTYMRNRGYLAQKLNTNLGSWTEIRHDTILYSKQSYSEISNTSFHTVGYVEPIPDLYSRLNDLTKATKKNLEKFNLISETTCDDLDAFSELLGKLHYFSEKELNNVPLNNSESSFIQYFGWRLEDLFVNVPEDAGDSRLVVDVHTDPNRDPKDWITGKVLEEAVGNFDLIVVIWNDTTNNSEGILRASIGPIFSYYEFKQPMAERMTDEDWRVILENGSGIPPQFNWQVYPENYPSLVDKSEFYDLWVSTEEILFSKEEGTNIVKITSFIHNRENMDRDASVSLYLDSLEKNVLMHKFEISVPGSGLSSVEYEWNVTSQVKTIHRIFVNVSTNDDNDYKPINNLAMGFVDLSNEFVSDPDWDGDGVINVLDDFPYDPAASIDTDGDGYPDKWNTGKSGDDSIEGLVLDEFPDNPFEWIDTDGDGIGDNSDIFPFDPYEWIDSDGDKVGDNSDAFPDDPAASVDTDRDGHPDRWNLRMSEKDSTTGLSIDQYPDDPDKWDSIGVNASGDNDVYILIMIVCILCILFFIIIVLMVRQRIGDGEGRRLSRYWKDIINDRIQEQDRLKDGEMERLLEERLKNYDISMETYYEILGMHICDEY